VVGAELSLGHGVLNMGRMILYESDIIYIED
jgi:hypothetical protein